MDPRWCCRIRQCESIWLRTAVAKNPLDLGWCWKLLLWFFFAYIFLLVGLYSLWLPLSDRHFGQGTASPAASVCLSANMLSSRCWGYRWRSSTAFILATVTLALFIGRSESSTLIYPLMLSCRFCPLYNDWKFDAGVEEKSRNVLLPINKRFWQDCKWWYMVGINVKGHPELIQNVSTKPNKTP